MPDRSLFAAGFVLLNRSVCSSMYAPQTERYIDEEVLRMAARSSSEDLLHQEDIRRADGIDLTAALITFISMRLSQILIKFLFSCILADKEAAELLMHAHCTERQPAYIYVARRSRQRTSLRQFSVFGITKRHALYRNLITFTVPCIIQVQT